MIFLNNYNTYPRSIILHILIFSILTCLIGTTAALRYQSEIEWEKSDEHKYERIARSVWEDGFGFDEGGTLELHAGINPVSLDHVLLLLPYTDWLLIRISGRYATDYGICQDPSFMRTQISGKDVSLNVSITKTDFYVLVACKCERSSEKSIMNVTSIAVNQNDQHLSLEKIPLIPLNFLLASLYTLLFLASLALITFRWRSTPRVQWLASVAMLAEVFRCSMAFLNYTTLSQDGETSLALTILTDFGSMAAESMFLALVLLTALGWSILREGMYSRERRLFWAALGLHLVFRILYTFCSSPSVCPAYSLSFSVLRFMIIFGVIVAANSNIERLKTLIEYDYGRNEELIEQLRMFTIFRFNFIIYVIVPISVVLLEYAVLSWQQKTWFHAFIEEGLQYYIFVILCCVFTKKPSGSDDTSLTPPYDDGNDEDSNEENRHSLDTDGTDNERVDQSLLQIH